MNADPLGIGKKDLCTEESVRHRCVFYISGFDPKGAGHYHALYREQAARYEASYGVTLTVGRRTKLDDGNAAWQLKFGEGAFAVTTHYEFMRWDDVVRNHWPKHTVTLWWQVIWVSLFNFRHGSLWAMYRLSWPPAIALVAPFALLCSVLVGLPVGFGLSVWAAWWAWGNAWWAGGAGLVVATCLAVLSRMLENRFSMYWMMRSYYFTARQALDQTPDLEERLNVQADKLAQRLAQGDEDEVLVVGHSSGAIMAAIVVARALQRFPKVLQQRQRRVSLMTLGQWLPLLGLLPMAKRFREELATLAAEPHLDWIDFSAPPDGCCFALCDPLQAVGISSEHRLRLKLLNPRFADMLDAAAYQCLKKDRLALHFQYLHLGIHPVDYNYFEITAGPKTLWDRFAHLPGVVDYSGLKPWVGRSR